MSFASITVLSTQESREWKKILKQTQKFDFYHLPEYHHFHEQGNDGNRAYLFVYRNKNRDKIIALPLLIRYLNQVPGLEQFVDFRDATSVYGYSGPITSEEALKDEVFIQKFRYTLNEIMQSWGVVSVFSRLHPILQNYSITKGLGELTRLGQTVAIDLHLKPEKQWALYRTNHKRDIKKLKRLEAQVFIDEQLKYLRIFHKLYIETMERVNASPAYFFTLEYFQNLFAIQGVCQFYLFLCVLQDEIISGGIFSECNGIVQYHLGATSSKWLKFAPMKLVFDEVRLWAYKRQNRWFHLGGGVGAANDSLFRFKSGFSSNQFPFYVWQWIVDPEMYRSLVQARQAWHKSAGNTFPNSDFFPKYRQ